MKYGKLIVNSAQELQPNCHVNQQFLEYFCAKDPSDMQKQALLEEIITQYTVKKGHEQDTHQHELHDLLSIEGFVEANECNQLQEDTDDSMKALEVQDQSVSKELQEVNAVQESNQMESTVSKEDLGSKELTNELANRKRTLDDRETRHFAIKRAYRRRRFWLDKSMDKEENGGKEHEKTPAKAHDCVDEHGCRPLEGEGITAHINEGVASNEDQRILPYAEQSSVSQPPHRPPPPPRPPKRAPPLLPSLRVVSMPSFYNGKQRTSLPPSCSTMANNYFLQTYGSHVHPKLPKYEELVANFTARKH